MSMLQIENAQSQASLFPDKTASTTTLHEKLSGYKPSIRINVSGNEKS